MLEVEPVAELEVIELNAINAGERRSEGGVRYTSLRDAADEEIDVSPVPGVRQISH